MGEAQARDLVSIDPDVRTIAAEFNLDPALVQAVVTAEGNIVRAVQCTYPDVTDRSHAIRITCRSIVHRLCQFAKEQQPSAFVAYMAAAWAPVGAKNDPKGLNKNWPSNVLRLWTS